jgi:hypothetical protein
MTALYKKTTVGLTDSSTNNTNNINYIYNESCNYSKKWEFKNDNNSNANNNNFTNSKIFNNTKLLTLIITGLIKSLKPFPKKN